MTDKPTEVPEEGDPLEPLRASKGLTVGRVVHCVDDSGQCVAAVVSRVIAKERGLVILHVLLPNLDDTAQKMLVIKSIYGEKREAGTWHWPEFVE